MTNEQINIAIFEIFGWKWEPEKNSFFHAENGRLNPKYAPDYCNDLNPMHEAEKTLTDEQWHKYDEELYIITKSSLLDKAQRKKRIHATARQRAEAFLRTLGKWKGAK